MSVLYVVRHGQASFGQSDYDQLSPVGLRQARLTGEHLAGLGVRLDAAFCGTQARQRDTAREVLGRLEDSPEFAVLPGLDEYDSGLILEALLPAMQAEEPAIAQALPSLYHDRRSFQIIYEGAMRRWISGRYDSGRAETWPGFLERAGAALDQALATGGRGRAVALFTSGGPISAVLRRALGLDDPTTLRMTWVVKNASISTFFFNERDLTLSLFNSTAHLDLRGEPGLTTYR